MDKQFTQTEVAIVGGGLAGLSAACYLARAGCNVTVFEKASEPGGRAATRKHDEFYFNEGIHALYTGGAAEQVLQELGIKYSGRGPKKIFMLGQGKFYLAPTSVTTLLQTGFLSLADKLALVGLFGKLAKVDARELAHTSVQTWLEQNVKRPRVYKVLESTARVLTYSAALELVSAEVFIKRTQTSLKHPVIYLDGGWQTLVDGLRRAAEQSGAKVVSGVRVEEVTHREGRAQGLRLSDGSFVNSNAIIIATRPQDAVKLVEQGNFPALRRMVENIVPAQVACLDVALSRLPNPRYPVVQDLEQPRFMTTHSLYSKVAPEGGALIYSFKQLDPTQPTDPHQDERELEDLLDTAQPGWREALVKRQYLPRINGVSLLPTAASGGYAGRPDGRIPGIANLYLAGDWIGSEGFLADASMASARKAAQLILQDSQLLNNSGEKKVSISAKS